MRVQTFLPRKHDIKFRQKMKDLNLTQYQLAQKLIVSGLNNEKEKELSKISTRELLQEVWNRIP